MTTMEFREIQIAAAEGTIPPLTWGFRDAQSQNIASATVL